MNFIGSKRMETERLILRPTEEQDLKVLWEILCIPEVNNLYLTCKFNSEWNQELPWQLKKLRRANNDDVFQWSIIKKDTNECIGQISVQEEDEDKSIRDIGWFINPKEWRKGYAFEAATKIIEYMFNEVEINSIETGAVTSNIASLKLMEKLGFNKRNENVYIVNYTFAGDKECFSYGLSAKEYKNNKILNKKL